MIHTWQNSFLYASRLSKYDEIKSFNLNQLSQFFTIRIPVYFTHIMVLKQKENFWEKLLATSLYTSALHNSPHTFLQSQNYNLKKCLIKFTYTITKKIFSCKGSPNNNIHLSNSARRSYGILKVQTKLLGF